MEDELLKIRIPGARAATYLAKFLAVNANSEVVDDEADPVVKVFTDWQWVEEWLMLTLIAEIKRGHKIQQRDAQTDVDPSDITRGA